MDSRPQNIFARQLVSFNPNFRIDTANPQMGQTGTDVYKIYGVTDNGEQSSISLSSSGFLEIYNDHTIQISAGTKNEKGREDIVIVGQNGNISISAYQGMVRIYADNIMLEAEEDIHFKAGKNINFQTGSGRILLDATRIDTTGVAGNFITELGIDFTTQVFTGSVLGNIVGLDKISSIVSDFFGDPLGSVVKAVVPI